VREDINLEELMPPPWTTRKRSPAEDKRFYQHKGTDGVIE